MDEDTTALWDRVATEVGVPIEGLEFICDSLRYTPQYYGEEPDDVEGQVRHCGAVEFCGGFVRFAKDTFGGDFVTALKLWGLDTSEKLGRVVYYLIDVNLIERQDGDDQSDFDGQFDLTKVGL